MSTVADVKKALQKHADPKRAKLLQGFFKTGPGDYGEGDVFIGVTMPLIRSVVREHRDLGIPDIQRLLASEVHEERMTGVLLLVEQFSAGDSTAQKKIYELYLASTDRINNWDLVDVTAHKVVGAYLIYRSRKPLYRLARSKLLWERRIAIISTFAFIKDGNLDDAFALADILLHDDHDLMHKAVGWVLRECGKKDMPELERFLKPRYKTMPRTMLRYTIEKFPEAKRQRYLKGRI